MTGILQGVAEMLAMAGMYRTAWFIGDFSVWLHGGVSWAELRRTGDPIRQRILENKRGILR